MTPDIAALADGLLEEVMDYTFHHFHCARNKLENGPYGLRHMKCDCGWEEVEARIRAHLEARADTGEQHAG